MKKVLALILALAMIACIFVGCSGDKEEETPSTAEPAASSEDTQATEEPTEEPTEKPTEEPVELVVFAAASLTETLNEIAEMYKSVAPNVTLVFNFDSSGTLKTQIEEGAVCDVFISAAQKQMNQLDVTSDANEDGLDFVLQGTRINLVENQVTLVVPEGNPAGVTSFEDVATDKVSMIALGNADVPVGQYSEELFTNMGIWEDLQSKITFGSNVKEVTTWVSEGVVDCGVVYGTDAFSAGLEVIAIAPADMLNNRVIYPAAVLNITEHEAEAKAFLEYLQTDACRAVFENVGFAIPE